MNRRMQPILFHLEGHLSANLKKCGYESFESNHSGTTQSKKIWFLFIQFKLCNVNLHLHLPNVSYYLHNTHTYICMQADICMYVKFVDCQFFHKLTWNELSKKLSLMRDFFSAKTKNVDDDSKPQKLQLASKSKI